MSNEGLYEEVCEKDRLAKAPSECSHEATESPMRLLQPVLCPKRYSQEVSQILYVTKHYILRYHRHMEDGCSKRFDIETVDFRPQNYGNGDQNGMRAAESRTADNQSRHPSYCSSAHYSPPPGSTTSQAPHESSLTSADGTFLDRHEYFAADNTQDPVWSS